MKTERPENDRRQMTRTNFKIGFTKKKKEETIGQPRMGNIFQRLLQTEAYRKKIGKIETFVGFKNNDLSKIRKKLVIFPYIY